MQITVLPFARNQPYDVYADIGFLPPEPAEEDARVKDVARAEEDARVDAPIIVPLLVTDTAEVSLQSRVAEIVRQLSGALSGQLYNIGASGNISGLRDQIAAVLGNDFNALSTVAQLSQNVARVRLGGAYQASSKCAMLPQANTVTLLVLVPKDKNDGKRVRNSPRILPVSLRTRLRNAVRACS